MTATKPKILVIDDSVLLLTMVRDELERAGYDVVTRDQPIGSGVAIMREQPDLVLLDVVMPALSGQDVVELVRRNPGLAGTKILLFSDRSEEEMRRLTASCGADGFIRKGRASGDLTAQVAAWVSTPASRAMTAPPPRGPEVVGRTDEISLLFVDQENALRHYRRAFCELPMTAYLRSGEEALTMLTSTSPPTWIICGLQLGDMSGEELYRKALTADERWRKRVLFTVDKGAATPSFLQGTDAPPTLSRPLTVDGLKALLKE